MNQTDHAKAAKWLSILWGVIYVIQGRISAAYKRSCTLQGDMTHTQATSAYQIIVSSLVLFFFIPLLYVIQSHAKKGKMKKLMIVARVLLGILIYWYVLYFISLMRSI